MNIRNFAMCLMLVLSGGGWVLSQEKVDPVIKGPSNGETPTGQDNALVGQTNVADSSPAANAAPNSESISQWRFRQPLELATVEPGSLREVILTPEVFDQARSDLSDLRLYDSGGKEIPYALQIRMPQQERLQLSAREFNRGTGPNESQELSLDLGESPVEHNEVEVTMADRDFRRRAVVEGSDDGQEWKLITDELILHLVVDGKDIKQVNIQYPPSRYRYLRLRVYRDPLREQDAPQITTATVHHYEDVVGEFVWQDAKFGERIPVRASGFPGSAWMIELGGNNTPCDQLEFQFAAAEFHRDYYLERADLDAGLTGAMYQFHNDVFDRALGKKEPLFAKFGEVTTGRIRLVVVDYRNPPLTVQSIRFRGVVRAVVFSDTASLQSPLYLYYGNDAAENPGYDFARKLPAKLPSKPVESKLGARESNPSFVPPPKPLTERWPWLVYVVLGVAIVGLAGLILSVARTAIASADARPENVSSQQPVNN